VVTDFTVLWRAATGSGVEIRGNVKTSSTVTAGMSPLFDFRSSCVPGYCFDQLADWLVSPIL
jgi:hypothetical protein